MNKRSFFYGIGVGPGGYGLIPYTAYEALKEADIILSPKGKDASESIAKLCLKGLAIPETKFQTIIYNMDTEPDSLKEHYNSLAKNILKELDQNKIVAYLTLGDSLTYSTYSYTLQSLLKLRPNMLFKTFPGITSYNAIASYFNFPIGQGKERVLILPCPDDKINLQVDIESHDLVILMKIGFRMPMVIDLLKEMNIAKHCVFASRLGLPDEFTCDDVSKIDSSKNLDYFSTMLIRKNKPRFTED